MAHVGKQYKLQFRRDLAVNFRNDHAYPEAAFGSTANFRGTIGNGFAGDKFLLVNLLKDNQPPMVWRASGHVVNGTALFIQATLSVIPNATQFACDLLIQNLSTGANLFHASATAGVVNVFPPDYAMIFGRPFLETPEIFCGGNEVDWRMQAAGWADYNP